MVVNERIEVEEQRRNLRQSIADSAALSSAFLAMNALATVVAGYGLLANSVAVVIGAMIIAALLGPIMGLALATVDGDANLFKKAFFAEVVGVALVVLIALLIGRIHVDIPITEEIISRTKPNLLDLAIALAGGAAGAYATVSPRVSVGLVGVAISTALVPPLAVCGICLSRGYMDLAGGAFILFLTNLVAIQAASSAVLFALGFHRMTEREAGDKSFLRRLVVDAALVLGLGVFLSVQLTDAVGQANYERNVRERLKQALAAVPGAYLAETRFRADNGKDIVVAVVRVPNSITPEVTARFQALLPRRRPNGTELHIRSLLMKETTAEGYLHEIAPAAEPVDDLQTPIEDTPVPRQVPPLGGAESPGQGR